MDNSDIYKIKMLYCFYVKKAIFDTFLQTLYGYIVQLLQKLLFSIEKIPQNKYN